MKDNRYQHQRWWVKLWRRRWYAIIIPLFLKYSRGRWETGERVGLSVSWSLAVGYAHCKMRWYHTMDEVFRNLNVGRVCKYCGDDIKGERCPCPGRQKYT